MYRVGMKILTLYTGEEAFVDDEDFDRVSMFSWTHEPKPHTSYASSNLGRGKHAPRVRLHRFILNVTDSNILVDHRDFNGLNCQKHNLRLATHQQNSRHSRVPQTVDGSGYRGVYTYFRDRSKYIARIRNAQGIKIHLGIFNSAEEAAMAYDEAAEEYHGEFAVLNFAGPHSRK